MKPRRAVLTLLALLPLPGLLACAREPLLHGLDERQANQVLVALDEAGLGGAKRHDDGAETGWVVEVQAADGPRARRVLAERELPRAEGSSFAVLFGKGSLVPTPAEERARLYQALAGELARSLEAVEGVAEARVHLALPQDDPLRPGPGPGGAAPPQGAVLLKLRPGSRARVEPLTPGLRALVAGAVAGLDPARVAVVIAEGAPPPLAQPAPPARSGLGALAAGSGLLGLALAFAGARRARLPILPRLPRLPWPRPGRGP